MGPNQIYKLLHSKGNHKQNEKTTYRMGENTYKWSDQQGLISKIYKQFVQFNNNNKKSNWKIGKRPKYTFLQRRNTDSQ